MRPTKVETGKQGNAKTNCRGRHFHVSTFPRFHFARRGMALLEVIVGAVILGIGLTVILGLASRSLAHQTQGEKQLMASWLADELLAMILVEGPANYPRLYDTAGRYAAPFDEFTFEIGIEDIGQNEPYRVTASVRWMQGRLVRDVTVQTLIAHREGEAVEIRAPVNVVDRYERWYGQDTAGSAGGINAGN